MMEEPIMELDELVYKVKLTVGAIQDALNIMHTKLGITDNEKVMALSWVITQLATAQVYRHYDIKE